MTGALMGRTLVAASMLVAALELAACGGGGTSITFTSSNGGSSTSGGVVLESRSAVVESDVDGDGLPDLVAVGRDGSGVSACWRNAGRAGWVDATGALKDTAAVAAIHDDCAARTDADLAGELGCHVAPTRAARGAAYGVVHVGDAPVVVSGPPVIDAVDPSSAAARSIVVIEGHALAAPNEAPTVSIGGLSATVLFAFADAVVAVVPDAAVVGAAEVRVTRGGLESAPFAFTVSDARTPVITAILPSQVQAGEHAVLRGDDLGGPLDAVTVTFAGVAATSVLPLSHALVVLVPATAVSGSVVVTVNGRASAPFAVTVGSPPAPTITALVPSAGSPGSLVRIEGRDLIRLSARTTVTFGGVEAAIFALEDGALTAIVPPTAADGDVVVRSGTLASVGVAFDVTTRGAPHIDSIDPSAARIGEVVHIYGRDLVDLSAWKPGRLPPFPLFGDTKVSIGGVDVWFFLPTVDGIDAIVPFGAATGSVVVTVGGRASNAVSFTKN